MKPALIFVVFWALSHGSAVRAQSTWVNPVGIDFGSIKVGRSILVSVTLQNQDSVPRQISGGMPTLPQFWAVNSCPSTLGPSNACQLAYGFMPDAAGSYAETTDIYLRGGGRSDRFTLSLAGTGSGGLAEVYPVSFDFGMVPLGSMASVEVTILNSHSDPLDSVTAQAVSPPFAVSNHCQAGLAPGASCVLDYIYTPTTAGIDSVQTGSTDLVGRDSRVCHTRHPGRGHHGHGSGHHHARDPRFRGDPEGAHRYNPRYDHESQCRRSGDLFGRRGGSSLFWESKLRQRCATGRELSIDLWIYSRPAFPGQHRDCLFLVCRGLSELIHRAVRSGPGRPDPGEPRGPGFWACRGGR